MLKTRRLASYACLVCVLWCASAAAQRDGEGSRNDRLRRWMEGKDKNGYGVVGADEVSEGEWRFLRRRAEREGIEPGEGINIGRLIEAREKRDGAREERPSRPTTRGFGTDEKPARVRGFGEAEPQTRRSGAGAATRRRDAGAAPRSEFRDRAERYARGIFERYDANKDGLLVADEWRRIRTYKTADADADDDGRVTRREFADFLEKGMKEKATPGATPTRSQATVARAEKPDGDDARKSYRFTPPQERLPDGLPGWFTERDRDGDGQVAMHEYSRTWTDGRASEFARHDKNGDGVVTPDELTKK